MITDINKMPKVTLTERDFHMMKQNIGQLKKVNEKYFVSYNNEPQRAKQNMWIGLMGEIAVFKYFYGSSKLWISERKKIKNKTSDGGLDHPWLNWQIKTSTLKINPLHMHIKIRPKELIKNTKYLQVYATSFSKENGYNFLLAGWCYDSELEYYKTHRIKFLEKKWCRPIRDCYPFM